MSRVVISCEPKDSSIAQSQQFSSIDQVDSDTKSGNRKRKYCTVPTSVLLLSALIFIIVYFTVLAKPTKVWKSNRSSTYELKTDNCIENIKTSPDGERKSVGDCYLMLAQIVLTTHDFNETHAAQHIQVTNLTRKFPNGTVISIDTFISKFRFLPEVQQSQSIEEEGLENINKLGNGLIVSIKQTGDLVGIKLPIDTHPFVFQAMFQLLQHTNAEFKEDDDEPTTEVPESMTSLSGQVNTNQTSEQVSSRQYFQASKRVIRRTVQVNENDLHFECGTTYNQEGQAVDSNLDANRSITQKVGNVTITLQGKTSQSINLVSEIFVEEDVIKQQKEVLKRQTLIYYDNKNISLAGVRAEQEYNPKEEVNNTTEEVAELPGGRLLEDIMEGSQIILDYAETQAKQQIFDKLIEQQFQHKSWKLKGVNRYRLSTQINEFINGAFSEMIQEIELIIEMDKLTQKIETYTTKNVKGDSMKNLQLYLVGGLQLRVQIVTEVVRKRQLDYAAYPAQQLFHIVQTQNVSQTISGTASGVDQNQELTMGVSGMLSNLTIYNSLRIYPNIIRMEIFRALGYSYQVQVHQRERQCTNQMSQVCLNTCTVNCNQQASSCTEVSYSDCVFGPANKIFENTEIKLKEPHQALLIATNDIPY